MSGRLRPGRLSHAGIEIDEGPMIEDGVRRFAWIRDPEDNRIELWEPDPRVFPPG